MSRSQSLQIRQPPTPARRAADPDVHPRARRRTRSSRTSGRDRSGHARGAVRRAAGDRSRHRAAWTASPSGTRCSSRTSRRFWASPGCIWRICTCVPPRAASASAASCSSTSRGSRSSGMGTVRVVGARLERAVDRVLQEDGRAADGRMDDFQTDRRASEESRIARFDRFARLPD